MKDQNQQQLIEDAQDAELGRMSERLTRLQNIATGIHTELEVQTEEITDLEKEIDATQNQLNTQLGKVKRILNSPESGKLCCIAVLVVLAIIFTVLIVET